MRDLRAFGFTVCAQSGKLTVGNGGANGARVVRRMTRATERKAHSGPSNVPRLQTVITNLRCNQACLYCNRRAEADDLAAISGAVLRRQIQDVVAAGTREIRLTGGEPTMRRDLSELIAFAREKGATQVSLETNATLVDDARARELMAAGLGSVRVNIVAMDARADAITRDPGGWERTREGLLALLRAGLDVDVRAVVTRSTLALLSDLPAALVAAAGAGNRPRMLEVAIPVESPDTQELLEYKEVLECLRALDAACRVVALPLSLAADSGPPPCMMGDRRGLPHLYMLTPGSRRMAHHRQLPVCSTCVMADRCPGVHEAYLRRFGSPNLTPLVEQRQRRRLTRQRPIAEQIAFELVSHSLSMRDGRPQADEIVRINFHCNQACAFCFVSTHLPAAADAQIDAAIRGAGSRGARVVLSGGEPTLNPRLLHWIALSKEVSRVGVCLQTNAVRLDNALLAQQVADAGVDEAFISLHGATAGVGDSVTDSPGTWARSVIGIDHLHALGVRVNLNYVFCQANMHEFADFVRLIAGRWPQAWANFSFVAASTDLVPKEIALIPKYSEMLPFLADGLAEAARLGVQVVGFESMCGLPLCLIPPPFDRETLQLGEIPQGTDAGEFVKADACQTCRYDKVCYGLRRGYAELHGTAELVTVPAPAEDVVTGIAHG